MTEDRPDIPHVGLPSPKLADPESLDDLWRTIEDGLLEDALEFADQLATEFPDDGNVALARAAAFYEVGLARDTLAEAERAGELGTSDDLLQAWYIAAAQFYMWRFPAAREQLDEIVRSGQSDGDEFAEAWYLLAQVCEMQEDEIGARRGYDRAFALSPERFHRPTRLSDEGMDEAMAAARDQLPPQFQAALDELAVVVNDLPTHELASSEGRDDPLPPDLLGLYVGTDRLDQSVFDPVDQPGVIFLFRKNLERICAQPDILVEEIRTTLWHELAHYLGFEEEDMAGLDLD